MGANMTLRILCFFFAFAPCPISLAFTVPLYADRWVSGGGLGTAIALAVTMGTWLACLITTLVAAGIHAGFSPMNVGPCSREGTRALRVERFLRLFLWVGFALIGFGLFGIVWPLLPSSASGPQIAFGEEEPLFLAANLLMIGFIQCIAANWMAKTEARIALTANHEKTRPA